MRKLFLIVTAIAVIAMLIGCSISSGSRTGSVDVNVNSSRFFSSDLDTNIVTYEVSMTHKVTGDTTGITSISKATYAPASFTDLMIGIWDVHVDAKNNDGTIVADGDSVVEIKANKTSAVNVQLEYFTGTGTLDFGVTWNAVVDDLSVTTVITKYAGTEAEAMDPVLMTLNEDELSADLTQTLDTGLYMITTTLTSDLFTTGKVETFEILEGSSTHIDFSFQIPQGNSGVIITDPESELFSMTITGITEGEELVLTDLPVTLTAQSDEPDVAWFWFINGILEESGDEETLILSDIPTGNYAVSCVGITDDGLSSETVNFSVSESEYLGR